SKEIKANNAKNKYFGEHLDLSEYSNLTKVVLGLSSHLTSLKLAHSNKITFINISGTGIDNFSFLAHTPNLQSLWLPQAGDHAYIAKAFREKQQFAIFQQENQAYQQTINDQQSQIDDLSNIAFPNKPYNFLKLKQDIIRLKAQELEPQVRNETTKLVQLISEAKNKSGNLSYIVDLILETQKQILQNSNIAQRDKLSGKIEAYQTLLVGSLTEEELQTLLNKQTEVQELENHLESLQQNLNINEQNQL
ncbi:1717_t:CDS:2, partial [Funneliformis geosporum]